MHCPFCRGTDTRVLDSRVSDDGGSIRRRRVCSECEKRFTTVELMQLTVLKRSGATEPFTREKAVAGVRKACKGRPVGEDDLARLGQSVEESIRSAGWAEVPAHEVGLAILRPLRELDAVAYLRFASVYKAFDSAADFESEIAMLRHEHAVRLGHAPKQGGSTSLAVGGDGHAASTVTATSTSSTTRALPLQAHPQPTG